MSPIDAFRAVHEELWDPDRGMDRFAPGVVPGVDIAPFDLHSVRETALGAFLDLEDGNVDRAITAIGNVLALQYPDSDRPWSGTFPVTAEQHDPPDTGAVEWVHYDPNWRQFLGCILAMCAIDHGAVIPGPTRRRHRRRTAAVRPRGARGPDRPVVHQPQSDARLAARPRRQSGGRRRAVAPPVSADER